MRLRRQIPSLLSRSQPQRCRFPAPAGTPHPPQVSPLSSGPVTPRGSPPAQTTAKGDRSAAPGPAYQGAAQRADGCSWRSPPSLSPARGPPPLTCPSAPPCYCGRGGGLTPAGASCAVPSASAAALPVPLPVWAESGDPRPAPPPSFRGGEEVELCRRHLGCVHTCVAHHGPSYVARRAPYWWWLMSGSGLLLPPHTVQGPKLCSSKETEQRKTWNIRCRELAWQQQAKTCSSACEVVQIKTAHRLHSASACWEEKKVIYQNYTSTPSSVWTEKQYWLCYLQRL